MENNSSVSNVPVTPPQQTSSISVQPNNSKNLIVLLVALEVVTLLVAGYFGYQLMQTKQQTPNNQILDNPTPTTSATLTPAVSDKSIYKYGTFSFTYPKSWQLIENLDDPFLIQNKMTKNDIQGFFDHVVLLKNGENYFLIGIDTHKTGAEVAGIFLTDKDYQDYLKNNDPVTIEGNKFYLSKINTTLEQWNSPSRSAGIYALATLSEYIPNKVTNEQNKTFNGYDFYIQKGNNSYMFIKLSKAGLEEVTTPPSIQSDIIGMLESITW